MKAFVINEHRMGCGLCVFKCEQNAIQLELVKPVEHIPSITMKELFAGRI